jgi:alpha-tubulin suppressor-like RCC1 family protein
MRFLPIAHLRFGSALALLALAAACNDNTDSSASGGQGGEGLEPPAGGAGVGGGTLENAGAGAAAGESSVGEPPVQPGDRCRIDDDCDDGLYCNGRERCEEDGDFKFCVVSELGPCIPENCDEAHKRCDCSAAEADHDGDGLKAAGCVSGNEKADCDDGDVARFPTNSEVCDPADPTHDEDCDPTTFAGLGGDGDDDGDKYVSSSCANYLTYQLSRHLGGERRKHGGGDCNDDKETGAAFHPDAEEICDNLDNDCDGDIDELPDSAPLAEATPYYLDYDRDSFGSDRPEDVRWSLCNFPPSGYVTIGGDCDDRNPHVAPSRAEQCNGYDDDCDGKIDKDGAADTLILGEQWDGVTQFECLGTAGWRVKDGGCPENRLDCDGEYKNACEVPATTLCNCHACETACSFSCGASGCEDIRGGSAGYQHTCFLIGPDGEGAVSGAVACAGHNASGELGTGTYQNSSIASLVLLPEVVTTIASGVFYSCAVGSTGKIFCWGANEAHQLGARRDEQRMSLPVEVGTAFRFDLAQGPMPIKATGVTAGLDFACGLYAQGYVACWGNGQLGQLGSGDSGDGYSENAPIPVTRQGSPLSGASQVVAGLAHACALIDGEVYCWGSNDAMQLGVPIDSLDFSDEAVLVPGLQGDRVDEIVAAGAHTCARAGTDVLCWGARDMDQDEVGPAQRVELPDDAKSLAAGLEFTCALLGSGTVSCWGTTDFDQHGPSTSSVPFSLPLTGVHRIFAGQSEDLCLLSADNSTWCFGPNDWGQLANGTNTSGQIRVRPLKGFQECSP